MTGVRQMMGGANGDWKRRSARSGRFEKAVSRVGMERMFFKEGTD